ncbi:MAG: response regulator [Anaerolineae bacterium]|nr:response regulator [Anaerolineae bacterium]
MNGRILYIEDNDHHIDIVRRILTAEHYDFYAARHALEGLARARELLPDLILSDINMPEVSGVELARQMKNDPALSAIPLVAVTTNTMHGDREYYLRTFFAAYVPKPIIRSELLHVVRHLLRKS